MTLTSITLTSIIISLFCCGWRVVTSEGMILYFLRKPFEVLKEDYEGRIIDIILFASKPFIMCITCFASFWGVIIYFALHQTLSINTIICCVISAFLNTLFYNLYERI